MQDDDRREVERVLGEVIRVGETIGIDFRFDARDGILRCRLELEGGRNQQVFVRLAGRTSLGHSIVTLFSPCARLGPGVFEAMSPEELRRLLHRPDGEHFVRFQVWGMNDHDLLVTSWDQVIETMEVEELALQVRLLAEAADAYERQRSGIDEY